MASPWVWSAAAHRYRNTITGRFIGHAEMVGLRDVYTSAKMQQAASLASRLAAHEISLSDWHSSMRESVKNSFIDQYVLGHGGRATMTQADWGRVGAMCKEQYKYLDGFAQAIEQGSLTEGQIRARSGLYQEASTQAFERGNAYARGLPRLPYYPGDGSTQCLTNCRCHWDIRESASGGWDCYWIMDPAAEHCPDCIDRAAENAPLHVGA